MQNYKELRRLTYLLQNPSNERSDENVDRWMARFEELTSHPAGFGLLEYPDQFGLSFDATDEQIAKVAADWTPRVLAMRVDQVGRHPDRPRHYLYELCVPNEMILSVLSDVVLHEGEIAAVATPGWVLPDGCRVEQYYHEYGNCMGHIIGRCEVPVGTDLSETYRP